MANNNSTLIPVINTNDLLFSPNLQELKADTLVKAKTDYKAAETDLKAAQAAVQVHTHWRAVAGDPSQYDQETIDAIQLVKNEVYDKYEKIQQAIDTIELNPNLKLMTDYSKAHSTLWQILEKIHVDIFLPNLQNPILRSKENLETYYNGIVNKMQNAARLVEIKADLENEITTAKNVRSDLGKKLGPARKEENKLLKLITLKKQELKSLSLQQNSEMQVLSRELFDLTPKHTAIKNQNDDMSNKYENAKVRIPVLEQKLGNTINSLKSLLKIDLDTIASAKALENLEKLKESNLTPFKHLEGEINTQLGESFETIGKLWNVNFMWQLRNGLPNTLNWIDVFKNDITQHKIQHIAEDAATDYINTETPKHKDQEDAEKIKVRNAKTAIEEANSKFDKVVWGDAAGIVQDLPEFMDGISYGINYFQDDASTKNFNPHYFQREFGSWNGYGYDGLFADLLTVGVAGLLGYRAYGYSWQPALIALTRSNLVEKGIKYAGDKIGYYKGYDKLAGYTADYTIAALPIVASVYYAGVGAVFTPSLFAAGIGIGVANIGFSVAEDYYGIHEIAGIETQTIRYVLSSAYQVLNIRNIIVSPGYYSHWTKGIHLVVDVPHAAKIWHIAYNQAIGKETVNDGKEFTLPVYWGNTKIDDISFITNTSGNIKKGESTMILPKETLLPDKEEAFETPTVEDNVAKEFLDEAGTVGKDSDESTLFKDELIKHATSKSTYDEDYADEQISSFATILNNLSGKLSELLGEVKLLINHDKTLFDFDAQKTNLTLEFLKANVDQVALNMWYLHEYYSFEQSDIINIDDLKNAINNTTTFDNIDEDFMDNIGITELKDILENVNNYFENIFEKQSYGYEYFYYEAEKGEELIAPPTFNSIEIGEVILAA